MAGATLLLLWQQGVGFTDIQAASGGGHTGGNTLPPWYLSGLSEALKPRGGCLSKICSFLPVKVMSYVMLPCTLPVESAVAVVQR